MIRTALSLAMALLVHGPSFAQVDDAPTREEGDGPYERLVLRGGILIDGAGAPPIGPVDIVIENNRIAEIRSVGPPDGRG